MNASRQNSSTHIDKPSSNTRPLQNQNLGTQYRRNNNENQSRHPREEQNGDFEIPEIQLLQQILLREPNVVVLYLAEPRTGLKEYLAQPIIDVEVISQLLKVLRRAFSTDLHPTKQHFIMEILISSDLFLSQISQLLFNRELKNLMSVLYDLGAIFEAIVTKLPNITSENLQECVKQSILVARCEKYEELSNRLEKVKTKIDNLQEIKDRQMRENRNFKMENLDNMDEPPEDFREIVVTPSIDEIRFTGQPFLRENIVEGKFKDVDHYLDVQFRLLREDFIAPLRTGINDYLRLDKNSGMMKIRDVRLYNNVVFRTPYYSKDGVLHVIQFDLTRFRNMKWDVSRRLIFGSLVCLSNDNFETAIFGSVADRNLNDLKQGRIKIKFEDESRQQRGLKLLHEGKIFVMAESTTYFEAYRHVLKGLQYFNVDTMPLQRYIVHVERDVKPPDYLDDDTIYDFSGIAKFDNFQSGRFQFRRRVVDINEWPSAQEMDVDESQRRAMHLSLSSAMAIIQGPPGTGKTYVGLKIMQILLSNRHVWRTQEDSSPILVVSLTNHALDQFLEGMLTFTKNVVRVGGRSQNEKLDKNNLRYFQRKIWWGNTGSFELNAELGDIRCEIEHQQKCVNDLKEFILHENALQNLTENDVRLVNSLSVGFKERFEVDPINKPWCPSSFLAVWLGLTSYIDFVSEFEIEEFYHRYIADVEHRQTEIFTEEIDVDDDDNFIIDDHENLIDVEDHWTAMNRNRQTDCEEMEEINSVEIDDPKVTSDLWSVDVNRLSELNYFCGGIELNETQTNFFRQMGVVRQIIAKKELCNQDVMVDDEVTRVRNVWFLPLVDRWRLYRRWVEKFRVGCEENLRMFREEYEVLAKRYRKIVTSETLHVMRTNDVVGMTTSGAARYLSLLQELGPKIVIVEEAAEVLESHIITSLSHKTQHLILIGDHQQLRPNPTVYQLAQKYHLDVSLFERLIKNEVRYETLQFQHRMRPEISRLLVPNIYKTLKDHPSVRKYPPIKGVKSNIFFLNHNEPEQAIADSTTRSNSFEAEFLVGLCRYLLQQDYKPSQITILATYAGQLFELRRLMTRDVFEGVKVTVVDNFQGEENDIILLSFVRSNIDGKIGFLNIINRVNVSLSRAKMGLFCVGNFNFLASQSEIWRDIVNDLEEKNQIGDAMSVICKNHQHESFVSCKNDFHKFVPEGGCLRPCFGELSCGHIGVCKRICHGYKHPNCEELCGKVICELNHTCPLHCYLKCKPCEVKVERVLPKCNHVVKLDCHINVDEYKCVVNVDRELPHCKHVTRMACHVDPENVVCKIRCDVKLEKCGHVCPRSCHPLEDVDHENVECAAPCSKEICERGHRCKNRCSQPCDSCVILVDKELPCGHIFRHPCSTPIVLETDTSSPNFLRFRSFDYGRVKPCSKPCKRLLTCGHQCRQYCSSPCGQCAEMVEKTLRCGHKVKVPCSTEIDSVMCPSPCTKFLSCGHKCSNICGKSCATECKHPVTRSGSCGHKVDAPCYLRDASPQEVVKYCNQPCGQVLKCNHTCRGTCGNCRQGRVHVPCTQKCDRLQICGHLCAHPCAVVCPPCNRKCAMECNHSRCNLRCGQLCRKCRQSCQWRCTHLECSKMCGDFCDRKRCNEPCTRRLPCGHRCVGLCGEICPKLCRVCNREELIEFVISGNEVKPDARFIQLKDCGHCVEVGGLDRWMDLEDEGIGMKGCPRCKSIIWSSWRYRNEIKRRVIDIQKVKSKLFGDVKFLRRDMERVYKSIKNDSTLKQYFKAEFSQLEKTLVGRYALYQNGIVVIENQVKILKLMTTMLVNSNQSIKSQKAKDHLEDEIRSLSTRLMENGGNINEWELEAVIEELQRVELWTKYVETAYRVKTTANPQSQRWLSLAYHLLVSSFTFTSDIHKKVENLLNKCVVLPNLGITDAQNVKIIKIMDLSPGHWYKCRNGHFYFTTEFGGRMQKGLCKECNARFGD